MFVDWWKTVVHRHLNARYLPIDVAYLHEKHLKKKRKKNVIPMD